MDSQQALDRMLQESQALQDLAAEWVPPHTTEAKPNILKPRKHIEAYSASSLYGAHIERPPLIVDGLIPAGLTVLAGAPKRGKSWLALKLGLAVAAGAPIFGRTTRKGEVLYLDLESRQYRVQDRLRKLLPGPAPAGLYISHEALRLDTGLLDQLKDWMEEHPNTSMVIIDTIGRVKGGAKRGENAYESDTRIFGDIQRFALANKLAIVCVHHLRKGASYIDDPLETISGSMGFSGACDAVVVLSGKRGEQNSELRFVSRDYSDQDLVIRFDNGRWDLVSANSDEWRDANDYATNQAVRGVIALAHKYGTWEGTASDLLADCAEIIEEPSIYLRSNELSRDLNRFVDQLREKDNIKVYTKHKGGGHTSRRVLHIELIGSDKNRQQTMREEAMPWEVS